MGLFDKYKTSEKEIPERFSLPGKTETGEDGEDPDLEEYITRQDKKLEEEIRKLKIGNEKELRKLIERELVTGILGEIGQSIKNNFLDQAKRRSNAWANLLGIPEKERQIEKLISEMQTDGIRAMKADIERLSDDKVFEWQEPLPGLKKN